jgi:hypothetical protein
MTTETKLKDADEIIEVLKDQAKRGSCKECKFLRPWGENEQPIEGETMVGDCAVQGNFNSIWFRQADLDGQPFPWKCDEGSISEQGDAGEWVEFPYCIAFRPQSANTSVQAQRDFFRALYEAMEIHNALKAAGRGRLTELLQELNAGI